MSKQRTITTRSKRQAQKVQWNFPLTKTNFLYLGLAMAVILIGFGLMATGMSSPESTTVDIWGNSMAIAVAPILLVVGFCVLVPYAIMKRDATHNHTNTEANS